MSFLPAFATWQFALAGAVCAAGPIILHLLNRRRFRVVEWAAMQFLLEAMRRRRRIMQLRDLLLMLLRTAAVLLFGAALARPFFAARQEQLDAGQPIHAVLLIDNSLSMGYQTLEGNLLQRAQRRAATYIDRLPVGSRITVLPLCGSEHGVSPEPVDTKPFAVEALQRVMLVDRSARFQQVVNDAQRAAELVPELAQRFVLFSDQQRVNWADFASLVQQQQLPAMQLVDVSEGEWDNSWVADVRVPDGVADAETPTTIQALVRHRGRQPRRDVRVSLWVRDQEVESQTISFESADATREVSFQYTMSDVQPEPAKPEFIPIKVVLSPDRLAEDDERHLLVPVVAALPVVFVDQFGAEEDPARNRLGETRHLRHLLAPRTARGDMARQLVQVRHLQPGDLSRESLSDARLVVVAGVSDPGDQVTLLREYVEQGGQLVVAAGADFDPGAWNAAGWREGQGILPLPLLPELLGALPDSAGRELKPMFLSYESLGLHPYFQLAGNSEDDLRDLYAEPFFFQTVQVDASPPAVAAAREAVPPSTDAMPAWLQWSPPELTGGESRGEVNSDGKSNAGARAYGVRLNDGQTTAAREAKVLARLVSEAGPVFLVERAIGLGHVVFASSGVLSNWNTLPKTNAIVMFDRILRTRLQATLPVRNFGSVERIPVPLPGEAREARIVLTRPGQNVGGESLETGFLRTDQVGATIEHPLTRGVYRLQAVGAPAASSPSEAPTLRWQLEMAVNGDEAESDLERLDRGFFERQSVADSLRWVDTNEEISLAGASIRGQDLWWWLALFVLLLMLLEPVVVLWPAVGERVRR